MLLVLMKQRSMLLHENKHKFMLLNVRMRVSVYRHQKQSQEDDYVVMMW